MSDSVLDAVGSDIVFYITATPDEGQSTEMHWEYNIRAYL